MSTATRQLLINGKHVKVQYTGESTVLRGKTMYTVIILEGVHAGFKKLTARAPKGVV